MKHRPQFTNLQAVRVQDLRLDVEERVGDAGEPGAQRVDVALGGGERVVDLNEITMLLINEVIINPIALMES